MTDHDLPARWLSERRRSLVAAGFGVCAAAVPLLFARSVGLTVGDHVVLVLLAFLIGYLAITVFAFSGATEKQIRVWAKRESRGTIWQRYVLGTAPGPGVSISIAAAALGVAVVWLPGHADTSFPTAPRLLIAMALISVAWLAVLVSYAVTFHADNLVEEGHGLDFPNTPSPRWADYVYFALSVMTTFGTTDVTVTSTAMRRTLSVNAAIAFVFNTFTVAAVVSALTG